MELKSCKRIAYGRSETPENTVARLEAILRKYYEYYYQEEKVSEHLYWAAVWIESIKDFQAMGKGTNAILSKAGALAEAAEWLTLKQIGNLPGYTTAYQEDLENPLKIEDLLTHVDTATPEVIEQVKQTEVAQHWADGYSLMTGETLKVPVEFVRRISGPSGVAAGNTLEEAIVHAFNEVFERRALITVLKHKLVVPNIDEDTIENPIVKEQIAFIRSKGIEVYIKDLSFGGELPCVGAYLNDPTIPEDVQFHHFFKVGSSFDKEFALVRTFTEYTQGRRLDEFIDGKPEEQKRILDDDFRRIKCAEDDDDNFLSTFLFGFVPHRRADFLKEGDLVPFDKGTPYEDCLDDIEAAKAICKKLGKDAIAIDFTHPDIGFPVAEVIVPGYSDILPFHPTGSPVLFKGWSRPDVLACYDEAFA